MKLNLLDFPDPEDFEVTAGSQTNTRRALSGAVFGSKATKRDILILTFGKMSLESAQAIFGWMYEHSQFGPFDLVTYRMESSVSCSANGFSGKVTLKDTSQSLTSRPNMADPITVTLYIESYETFPNT